MVRYDTDHSMQYLNVIQLQLSARRLHVGQVPQCVSYLVLKAGKPVSQERKTALQWSAHMRHTV